MSCSFLLTGYWCYEDFLSIFLFPFSFSQFSSDCTALHLSPDVLFMCCPFPGSLFEGRLFGGSLLTRSLEESIRILRVTITTGSRTVGAWVFLVQSLLGDLPLILKVALGKINCLSLAALHPRH